MVWVDGLMASAFQIERWVDEAGLIHVRATLGGWWTKTRFKQLDHVLRELGWYTYQDWWWRAVGLTWLNKLGEHPELPYEDGMEFVSDGHVLYRGATLSFTPLSQKEVL